MCVAIFKPAGKRIDKADMALAHAANNDGCGFAVRIGKQIHVEKGVWNFEEFWSRFSRYHESEVLLHFRWATIGGISREMCHPMHVGTGALIHNGHIMGYGTKTESDTAHYCAEILSPILANNAAIIKDKSFQKLLAHALGSSNKMAIMLPSMPVVMLGKFTCEQGVWYSNFHYRTPRKASTIVPAKQPVLSDREQLIDAYALQANRQASDERLLAQWDNEENDGGMCPPCEVCETPDSAIFEVCSTCYDNAVHAQHTLTHKESFNYRA